MQLAPGFLFPDARLLSQMLTWCDIAQGDSLCRIRITGRLTTGITKKGLSDSIVPSPQHRKTHERLFRGHVLGNTDRRDN
jgi:hypothetical protein